MRLLAHLASLRLTLVLIAASAGILLYATLYDVAVGTLLVAPFCGLFLNLLAALAVHERLRAQRGLLAFHLGLAGLAGLAAFGRLVAMSGHIEIAQGMAFDPANVAVTSAGPLHTLSLPESAFVQGGFSINYDAGMQRRDTRSAVQLPLGGGWQEAVVGDDHPLVIDGYRFYTTSNKGFAAVLTHIAADGGRMTGLVHMPSYPLLSHDQANQWMPPGSERPVDLWLHLPQPVYDENAPWVFGMPQRAVLVVEDNGRRRELAVGEVGALSGGGALRFDGLRPWIGYKIFYEPTLPWLMAVAGVSLAGLGWHAVGRLAGMARHMEEGEADAA